MEKRKIIIELTEDELKTLNESFVTAKKLGMIQSHIMFDEFLRDILVAFTKGPKLNDVLGKNITETFDSLKETFGENVDMSELLNSFMGGIKPKEKVKEKPKSTDDEDEELKS